VRINSGYQTCLEIEQRLIERYKLNDGRVIPNLKDTPRSDRLGQAAAQFLMQRLPPRSLLAVGWGEMVSAAIQRLGHLANEKQIDLVGMAGGVQTYVDGLRLFGRDGEVYLVPAPLLVGDAAVAQSLMREASVHNTLDMSLRADYALVGIGAVDETASVIRSGYIHPTELQAMRRRGAVGDVLCRFIDADGGELDLPLHDRVIGLSLEALRKGSAQVIAAAGGSDKLAAIRAALKGGFINVFITDEATASALLA
jgi:lsr operon transcriptional repressor